MESLLKAIAEYILVSEELKIEIETRFEKQFLPKNEILLKENTYCNHFYFLEKGLIRSYFLKEGKERTYWFYDQGNFFTSWYSFYLKMPGFETLEAIEDTHLYKISKDNFDVFTQESPRFERFARLFIEGQCGYIDYVTKNFMDLTAKEKYDQLLESMPDIEQRAKLGQIASFLGMSQETLSRLRGQK